MRPEEVTELKLESGIPVAGVSDAPVDLLTGAAVAPNPVVGASLLGGKHRRKHSSKKYITKRQKYGH